MLEGIFVEAPSQTEVGILTPCYGFEVQNHTHAHMSIKDLGNTINLNPKWARILPMGTLHGILLDPSPQIEVAS